jgi:hypothetical protein
MGFRERLGLLVILSGAPPAQPPAKSTEGPQPRRLYGRYLCTRSGFSVHGVPYAQALFATDHGGGVPYSTMTMMAGWICFS